jgi:hypothetical protein
MLAAFHSRAVDVDTFEAEIIKGGYTNAPGVMFIDLFTGHETGHNHYRTKEVLPPISDLRLNWIAPESEMYCVTTYVADCENQVLIFSGGKHRVDRRDLAVWDLFPGWDGDLYIRDLYGNCGGELRAWNAFRRQTLWVCQERIQGLQLLAGEILYGTDNQSRLVAIDTEKGQVLWRSQERGLQEAIAAGQSIYATFIRADRSGKGQVYTLSAYVPMVKEVQ